jgi:hypothetical protein
MPIEKPILFNGEMVRAVLEDRKNQTRRVIKKQPDEEGLSFHIFIQQWINTDGEEYKCPYGNIGDQLWVRETFNSDWCDKTIYKADGGSAKEAGYPNEPRWKPSIHMPRWASRINLEITDIRVERVQDISEEDARDEGMECLPDFKPTTMYPPYSTVFKKLWDSINGKPRADGIDISWEANPFVWCVTFKRINNDN